MQTNSIFYFVSVELELRNPLTCSDKALLGTCTLNKFLEAIDNSQIFDMVMVDFNKDIH